MIKQKKFTWKKFNFRWFPSTLLLLFLLNFSIILISWIPGTTGTWTDSNDQLQPGLPLGIFDLFFAPIQGFIQNVNIIIFILVIGGYIGIVIHSKALDAAIERFIVKMKHKEIWIIPVIMLFLALGGTVEGMSEETLPYYLIIMPVMLASGFDLLTTLFTILLGAGVGVCFSTLNPFSIVTAATIAGVDIGSGFLWRFICWLLGTLITIAFVMLYARKVKKDPKKSVVFHLKTERQSFFKTEPEPLVFTLKRKIIFFIFAFTFLIMILVIIPWDKSPIFFQGFVQLKAFLQQNFPYLTTQLPAIGAWGVSNLAVLFFISSIIVALISGIGEKGYIHEFIFGASELLGIAFIIAAANGISWSIQQCGMQEKLVFGLNSLLAHFSKIQMLLVGYFIFILLSFFIPSSSGFAIAVFPVIKTLTNAQNITSGMITTFTMANGWINLFAPTAGVMMAALVLCKISLKDYYKAIWPYIIVLTSFSLLMLIIGSFLPNWMF